MRRRSAALVLVLLVPALAACTGGTPEPQHSLPPMFAVEFDRLLDGTSITDLERAILDDHQITDAEYTEAREAFRTCATDAGFDVALLADGGIDMGPGPELASSIPSTDDQAKATDAIYATCQVGTIANVGRLYEWMRSNPEGLSSLEQLRACFERNGVADGDGRSDDQLLDLLNGDRTLLSEGARACQEDPERGR